MNVLEIYGRFKAYEKDANNCIVYDLKYCVNITFIKGDFHGTKKFALNKKVFFSGRKEIIEDEAYSFLTENHPELL